MTGRHGVAEQPYICTTTERDLRRSRLLIRRSAGHETDRHQLRSCASTRTTTASECGLAGRIGSSHRVEMRFHLLSKNWTFVELADAEQREAAAEARPFPKAPAAAPIAEAPKAKK